MPSTREYRRIFRRLFVTHLGLALLPLVALGIFSIDRINSIYDEKISAGIEAVCSSKHRALDTFLHERISQIKTLAFTHGLAELRDPDRLSRIFTVMQQSGRSFVDLGIIGMDGRHISYVGPFDLRDANYVSAPWFTEVLRKGVFVSDVFMGFRNVPHFIIAVLRHEGGESFIMRATIDMEAINSLLQRVYSGERSDAFLINEQGVLQTDSRDYGRIMEQFNVTLPNVLRQGIALVPLPSQPGDSGSKEPLAAMMHLDSMPWLLVVVDDVRESLAPLHRLRIYILLFVGLGAVLVTVGAFLGTRYIVSCLAAADRKQAHIDARMLQSSKMAALGKMAAGVAHEVNNPLAVINEKAGLGLDLLHMSGDFERKDRLINLLEAIESTVERARGITHRLLGFARRMEANRQELSVPEVLTETMGFLERGAKNRGVNIGTDFAEGLPDIVSDRGQLQQVFLNIMGNALDAVPDGGKVDIACPRTDGGGLLVRVTDNGKGMSPEVIKHIFEPFYSTKKEKGNGLGMFITYGIVRRLGGEITVDSTEGKGTTVSITLPLTPPERPVEA